MILALGDALKSWRKGRRFTYKELSGLSGVSEATLSRWESGKTLPRIAELEAVLNALQVSPAQRQQALSAMEAPRAVKQLRLEAEDALPVSGDLLRAMRLRRGWTQQETARQAGISQGTLAKWERSEDWPAVERLHALCFVLQAHEEELVALSQKMRVQDIAAYDLEDRAELEDRTTYILFASPVPDLEFLELETRLWRVTKDQQSLHIGLSYVYGCHARFLAERRRYAEAGEYVRRTEQLARNGFQDAVGWQSALIAAARKAGNGENPDPKRGIQLLQRELRKPPTPISRGHYAWMYSEVARLLNKLDYHEQALSWSEQAIRMASSVSPTEHLHRRGDHVRLLVEMENYPAALEECDWCLNHYILGVEFLPFQLIKARILLTLNRVTKAQHVLQQIDAGIQTYSHLTHFRPQADALRAEAWK